VAFESQSKLQLIEEFAFSSCTSLIQYAFPLLSKFFLKIVSVSVHPFQN
jgi:hypothetical protein